MVCADHVNSWGGVVLLIPLLKHTNKIYIVCIKISCVTDAYMWEVVYLEEPQVTQPTPD